MLTVLLNCILHFILSCFQYFTRQDAFFAHDPDAKCKTGDFVLIEELQNKLTRDITHKVLRIVYPNGDITDPITGKKCVGNEYREDMEWKDNLWGKNPKAFDYNQAPPRGWQEGRKDSSHTPGYMKWHDFVDKDQPEAVY